MQNFSAVKVGLADGGSMSGYRCENCASVFALVLGAPSPHFCPVCGSTPNQPSAEQLARLASVLKIAPEHVLTILRIFATFVRGSR